MTNSFKALFLVFFPSILCAEPSEKLIFQGKTIKEWTEQLLKSTKTKDREEAALTLGELGPKAKDAVPSLILALKDNSRKLNMQVVDALARIGPDAKSAIPALKNLSNQTKSKRTRQMILQAIQDIERTSTKWTIERLNDFGIHLKEPSEELVDQLELPKGQGLVIEHLEKMTMAEKVGIKLHDILLEINEQHIPDNLPDFLKLLESIKPNQDIKMSLLRRGSFVTLKAFKFPTWIPPLEEKPSLLRETYIIQVREDSFTGRYRRGRESVTVEGKFENRKPIATSINIFLDSIKEKYRNIDDMPAKYKKYVRKLMPMGLFRR